MSIDETLFLSIEYTILKTVDLLAASVECQAPEPTCWQYFHGFIVYVPMLLISQIALWISELWNDNYITYTQIRMPNFIGNTATPENSVRFPRIFHYRSGTEEFAF